MTRTAEATTLAPPAAQGAVTAPTQMPQAATAGAPAAVLSEPEANPAPARWSPPSQSATTRLITVLLLAAAIGSILYAWRLPPFRGHYEQTNDAFVRGQTTVISPQVSGYVSLVPVSDFQEVSAGDVLVRIEDSIYSARVEQARANVLAQVSNLENSAQAQRSKEAGTLAQDAGITGAEAQLTRAQSDWKRLEPLVRAGWATRAQEDQSRAALQAAEAQLLQARAARAIGTQDVRTVIVGRSGLTANVEAAKAQVRLAEVDLGHTVIRAPQAGHLSEVAVRTGQYVTAGTQLMYLVPSDFWVIANFKEAQTHKIRRGQKASFTVDALGEQRLNGTVESLAPASGSEFAVLRPDNATGNFVKVAQRIAVRIRIDPNQPLAGRLRPGMSVVARVMTEDR